MKLTSEQRKRIIPVLCLWLCILMIVYLLLHTFYSITLLPNTPLLAFLPSCIYILGGLLIGGWSIGKIRQSSFSAGAGAHAIIVVVFCLSLLFLLLGSIFCRLGLQQLHILR